MQLTKEQILSDITSPKTASICLFANEWSSSWGRAGIGYFGADYLSRCVEIGTMVNIDNTKYIFTKILRIGSKGYDVKQLQTKVGITADGVFGKKTKLAVMAFQIKHLLIPDGVVGKNTNYFLNN